MKKEYLRKFYVLFLKKVQVKKEYLCQIWTLVIPLLMENTLQTLLGTVDRYFASSLDDSAFAAIGVTEIVMNLYLAFFMAVNIGVSVVIGKNIGKNDVKQASEAAKQGVFFSIMIGVAIGLVSLSFGRQFLLFTGCTEEILGYALPYFKAVAVPSIFLSLSLTLSACLRATKDTKTPMLLTSFCNILNIFLNILFIQLGFGIFGIGLSTSISRFLLTIGLLVALFRKKEGIHLHFKKFRLNLPVLKEITSIGLPAGCEKLAMRIGQFCYTAMILSLGTEAYIAHTLTATIENYIYIPIFSFATTTSVLVSISLGEGNFEKANDYVSLLSKINTMILLVFSCIFVLFGANLAGIFTDSEQVISDTARLLIMLACAVPFMGVLNIYTSALQGSGDTKTPMYSTLFGIWVIRFGLGFVFTQVFALGITGFWVVITLDCVIRSAYLYVVYRQKFNHNFNEPVPYARK